MMETIRRHVTRLLPTRREVTDEEAREAAVPLQPLFGLPLQPIEEDDLTPQPSFVTRPLSARSLPSSLPPLPPLTLPAAAGNSASATPITRRSPITTIRPLTIQPAAHVGAPSAALAQPITPSSNNRGNSNSNGNGYGDNVDGTSSITISRGSHDMNDHSNNSNNSDNNNNSGSNNVNHNHYNINHHGLDIPLARTVSSGAGTSLWLPMVGRLGFFLFKLVVVCMCAVTVFILLAALSGPWSYLQPKNSGDPPRFIYQNTTVSSTSPIVVFRS
jgi:hypothetical protein